jgi:outer membrane immunogenic protein
LIEGLLMRGLALAFAVALSVGTGATALAAEIPAPPALPVNVPAPPPPYDWTGLYFGGNLGAGWSRGNFSDAAGNTFTTTSTSQFLGGGQLGVNYQFWGGVVIGAEGDFDWLPNTNNSSTATALNGNTATVTINNRFLTTATGRVGYAWDRVLLYGRAGGAWVGGSSPGLTVNGAPALTFGNFNLGTNFGWTAGMGVEWAFLGSWSVRAEYDFIGLNNQTFTSGNAPAPFGNSAFTSNNRNIQMVTAGVNYKFGGW